MKINILGTEYDFEEDKSIIDVNADGICKEYSKKILIRPKEDMLLPEDNLDVKERRYREVVRHEVIYAFFDESGLGRYSENEELVCWLAVQIPKMNDVFEQLKAGER